MTVNRILNRVTIVGVCLVVFVWGCAQEAQQPGGPPAQPKQQVSEAGKAAAAVPASKARPSEAATKPPAPGSVKIALKPTPGEQTSYKVTTQARRSIKWQGPVPQKDAFAETFNDEQAEMVITQRIQSVDANGRVVAQVTIDSLKYLSVVKNQTSIDFDGSRQSDASSPLAKLIGQSYTIEFGPDNNIASVSDLSAGRALMNGRTAADRAGQNVLSPEAITERHATLLLPQSGQEQLNPGDKWNKIKTFTFGLMGLKSYEKIYTLRETRDVAGHRIAVIDMNAIPSSEVENKYREQQAGTNFPKMFDTNDIYTGSGEVDLTAGRINSFRENLQASWVAALPPNPGESVDANEPVVLRMTATREYSLERIK
jgi:hypothetical protein